MSVAVKEIQIKLTLRINLIAFRMAILFLKMHNKKESGEREVLLIAGGNAN